MEMDLPKQNKDIKITEAIKIFPLMFKWVLKVEKLIKVNATPWAGHSLYKQALPNRQPVYPIVYDWGLCWIMHDKVWGDKGFILLAIYEKQLFSSWSTWKETTSTFTPY